MMGDGENPMNNRMTTVWIAVVAMALGGCTAVAGESKPSLESSEARESYSLGQMLGVQLREGVGDVDAEVFAAGIADALSDRSRLDPQEVAMVLEGRRERDEAAAQAEIAALAEKNRVAGEAFRASFAEEAEVVTLETGVQYKVLEPGDGEIPPAGATVKVHYRGTFVDGTEFDNSYGDDEPVAISLDRVIPGWSEALTRMPVGSVWKIVIPPSLAYGEAGAAGFIEPNATLVFEVELVEIG
jgi:FKBP-type peptidyl-prolyl cis-trans isomerase FklB